MVAIIGRISRVWGGKMGRHKMRISFGSANIIQGKTIEMTFSPAGWKEISHGLENDQIKGSVTMHFNLEHAHHDADPSEDEPKH